MAQRGMKRGLVILDKARCHETEMFKSSLRSLGLSFIFIPGGMTGK